MEHKQQIDLSEYHERAYGNKALSDDALSKYAAKAIEHVSLDKRARNTRIKVIMLRVSGILIAAVLLLCIIWPDLARAFISVLGFSVREANPQKSYTGSMWTPYDKPEYVVSKITPE